MKTFIQRAVVIGLIEIVSLLLLSLLITDFSVEGWQAAVLAVVAIGFLNATVRPILLLVTLPFTILTFGFLTLILNGIMILIASNLVDGFQVDSIWGGVLVSAGLTVLSTLFTGLFSMHDDSYYLKMLRFFAKDEAEKNATNEPGILMLEIDGLSEPILQKALKEGYMPTLAQWLQSGSHRVVQWNCGLPSQTSASQAGILYGNNDNIPAFRWYEKGEQCLVVSNKPQDALRIAKFAAESGSGLLMTNGSSVNNLVDGNANRYILTMSKLADAAEAIWESSDRLYLFLYSPYNFSRVMMLMIWDLIIELKEGFQQRKNDVRPRVSRLGIYPLLRVLTTVLLRDLSLYMMAEDMFSGVSAVYTTFVGYDEVAHHAGIDRPDSLRILRKLDDQLQALVKVKNDAPRPYHFVLLSDHGQSQGATFKQRYGETLEEFVQSHLSEGHKVDDAFQADEGWGYVTSMFSEALHSQKFSSKVSKKVFKTDEKGNYVEFNRTKSPHEESDSEVVVCVSGNLGLIYFVKEEGRLTHTQIKELHPDLLQHLVEHDGIGFVMVKTENGALVLGKNGQIDLETEAVKGENPLENFGEYAVQFLQRLHSFNNVGDIVVNSMCDPETGEVAAFEELVGSHGGLGGYQNQPFLMFPAELSVEEPIVGAVGVYKVLQGWLGGVEDAE